MNQNMTSKENANREGRPVFINYSNHPSAKWNVAQRRSALQYGDIVDVPFLKVDPTSSTSQVVEQARGELRKITRWHPVAVLCQGEFTMTHALIRLLQEEHIPVVTACSERKTTEAINDAGETVKMTTFSFVAFREYPAI